MRKFYQSYIYLSKAELVPFLHELMPKESLNNLKFSKMFTKIPKHLSSHPLEDKASDILDKAQKLSPPKRSFPWKVGPGYRYSHLLSQGLVFYVPEKQTYF